MPTPKDTGIAAATIWPMNFSAGVTPHTSSITPRTVMSVAPINSPKTGRSNWGT